MGRYPLGSNLVQKGVRPLVKNLEVLNDFGQKGGPKSGSESGSKKVIPWCQTMDISIDRPDRPDRPDRGSVDPSADTPPEPKCGVESDEKGF